MTFGPIEPSITGSSIDLPVALSVSVIDPVTAPTFVLLPSMDHLDVTPAGGGRCVAENSRWEPIIKRRSDFAIQYRICEKNSRSGRSTRRIGDAPEALFAPKYLHHLEDAGRCE